MSLSVNITSLLKALRPGDIVWYNYTLPDHWVFTQRPSLESTTWGFFMHRARSGHIIVRFPGTAPGQTHRCHRVPPRKLLRAQRARDPAGNSALGRWEDL